MCQKYLKKKIGFCNKTKQKIPLSRYTDSLDQYGQEHQYNEIPHLLHLGQQVERGNLTRHEQE